MKNKQQVNNPFFAINCLLQGLNLLKRKELRRYLIIPICINLVLYSIAFAAGYYYLTSTEFDFIPDWLSWLEWLIVPAFFVSFFIICFFTFTLLANLIASPFYSQLAIKTRQLQTGESHLSIKEPPVSKILIAELMRQLYLVSRMLPILVLFLIPGINLIAPFLWLIMGAWTMGLEFMAYPLENEGVLFSEQKQIAKSQRIGTLSFGGLVMLGLSIPVIHLVVAPAAVIAATLYTRER